MKKLSILLALALGGCASAPRPQVGVVPIAPKIAPKVVAPAPKVEAAPPAIAAPLVKPKWYDKLKDKQVKWHH